ncbi:DUF4184 family protein [Paraclostridium bifermentans]|nr:DUF4184 family protein [Paraclostridium bifermentans]
MLTHIIWDAFTHKTGYFVVNISLLKRIYTYTWLSSSIFQIASTW